MARLRRYELYDGDGEMIPEEYVPLQERGEKTEAKKPAGAKSQRVPSGPLTSSSRDRISIRLTGISRS